MARPPAIPPTHTFVYKTVPAHTSAAGIKVDEVGIKIDVFLPQGVHSSSAASSSTFFDLKAHSSSTLSSSSSSSHQIPTPLTGTPSPTTSPTHPVLLFIHGGGWIHSNRSDYGRTWFLRFLEKGFVVCSMDYRLLPESSFEEMCEDVADAEGWVRGGVRKEGMGAGLEGELRGKWDGVVDGRRVVVAGASAGAHLALLTPYRWTTPPLAILSLYGPTNFHSLPYLNRGPYRPDSWPIPECTPALLAEAAQFSTPPTEFPVPTSMEDKKKPRHFMGQHVYRRAILAHFLVRGLVKDEEGLRLPERVRDGITEEEVNRISPLHLLFQSPSPLNTPHPPTYQLLGTSDALFLPNHITDFATELSRRGVQNVAVLVEGKEHGFETGCVLGDEVDVEWVAPAVEWLCRFV